MMPEDIEKKCRGVTTAIYATRSVLQVIHENKNWSTIVVGTTPEVHRDPKLAGRPRQLFHTVGHGFRRKVVVLGKTAAQNLYETGEERRRK